MCKDLKTRYGDLTLKQDKDLKGTSKAARGQGQDSDEVRGVQFFFLEGAESLGVVAADSVIARELHELFNVEGAAGVLEFPRVLKDWRHGNIKNALGAQSFSVEWVSLYQ